MKRIPVEKPIFAEEVANFLSLTKRTVERKARKKEIPARKAGKAWYFLMSEVVVWLKRMPMGLADKRRHGCRRARPRRRGKGSNGQVNGGQQEGPSGESKNR